MIYFNLIIPLIILLLLIISIWKNGGAPTYQEANEGFFPKYETQAPAQTQAPVFYENNKSISEYNFPSTDSQYVNYFNYFYPYDIFHQKFKGQRINYGRSLYSNLFLI